jgi:hypothetical protein
MPHATELPAFNQDALTAFLYLLRRDCPDVCAAVEELLTELEADGDKVVSFCNRELYAEAVRLTGRLGQCRLAIRRPGPILGDLPGDQQPVSERPAELPPVEVLQPQPDAQCRGLTRADWAAANAEMARRLKNPSTPLEEAMGGYVFPPAPPAAIRVKGEPLDIQTDRIYQTKADKQDCQLDFYAYEIPPGTPIDNTPLLQQLTGTTECDKYRDSHGKPFEPMPGGGYMSVPILEMLWGMPLCDAVIAHVQAFKPTSIVIGDCITTVCSPGRVHIDTVVREGVECVRQITQEVNVGGQGCGHDVRVITRAIKDGTLDQYNPHTVAGQVIGHTAGLARADFS